MLRQMSDMPAGTIGFEAVGKVDDDDFEHVVEPVLRREIAAGHRIRLLYLLGVGLKEYEGDALAEEMKFAAGIPRRTSGSPSSATRTGSGPRSASSPCSCRDSSAPSRWPGWRRRGTGWPPTAAPATTPDGDRLGAPAHHGEVMRAGARRPTVGPDDRLSPQGT